MREAKGIRGARPQPETAVRRVSAGSVSGAVALALFLGACSQVPNWADPTRLFAGEEEAATRVSLGEGLDERPEGFPSLGSVPDAPSRLPSRMAERQELLRQLERDRRGARYITPESGETDQEVEEEEVEISEAERELQRALDREERSRNRSAIPMMQPSRRGEPVELPPGLLAPGVPEASASRLLPAQFEAESEWLEDQPLAVIHFAHGSSALDAAARRVLRQVVALERMKTSGLRVVGHASSRTGVMEMVAHRSANLEISMARADAVAAELRRLGLERERLWVEAQGDGAPAYHEFMDTGEAGNRRVEIYAKN